MTKQGSFKRAVRDHAVRTGQRYTEAHADLEIAEKQAFVHDRPFERDQLSAHLEARYGLQITSLASIDDDPKTRPRGSWPGHYPATLRLKHKDRPPWIARIFSSPADRVDRVEGDADILRFLAEQQFPAEKLAHPETVSVLNGSGIIVTEFIEGGRPDASTIQHELGSLRPTPQPPRRRWCGGAGRRIRRIRRRSPRRTAQRGPRGRDELSGQRRSCRCP